MRTVWIGLLCFTLIGLIFAAQLYLYLHSFGRPVTWGQTLKWNLGSWYLWALLCPVIFGLSRRIIELTRTSWPRAIVAHLGCGVLVASVHVVAYATWTWFAAPLDDKSSGWRDGVQSLFIRGFSWDLFCYAAIATAHYAIDNARRFREGQVRASQLETQLAQAQLDALRMQLHPHFLFNTLNAITALIREDPRGAEEMVTRLSELLRLALDKSDVQQIPLRDELDFVRKYLEIQRVRFGDRLDVSLNVAPETLDVAVPTFVLQPVIENAVRYGLSSEEKRCHVRVIAGIADRALLIEVHDSGPGLGGDADKPVREGIGISNTRARLHQLYGARARFELRNASPIGCVVSIHIPMISASTQPSEVDPG